MFQETIYCSGEHSSKDVSFKKGNNFIGSNGYCSLCFTQEVDTWTSGNAEIDKVIQKSQIGDHFLQWIPYENFQDIKYIADGGYGSVYSTILKDSKKWRLNFDNQDWAYFEGEPFALKELKNSRYSISEFLKEACSLYFDYRSFEVLLLKNGLRYFFVHTFLF